MANQVFDRLLRQMPVRRRIVGGFLLILAIAGAVAPVILLSFNSLVTRLEQFTNVDVKIERLLLLTSRQVTTSQLNLNRYIQDYVPSPYEAQDDVKQALQNLNEARAISTNSDQTETITLIVQSLEEYQQLVGDLQKARASRNNDEATRLESKLQKLGNDISVRLELLVNSNVKLVAATNEEVLNDAQHSLGLGLLIITVGFILAVTFSALISLSITRPLAELRAGTEAFQKGDMSSTINAAGADEFTVFAQILNSLTKQIRELISNLETRVAERTADLELARQQSEKRASELKAVSEVARAVSTEVNLENLLTLVTNLVSERFGFYHVGIFLPDGLNQYAVLRASNSPGGKRMIARGHKLPVGQVGIVGYVAAGHTARIALNVGEDAVFFNNPDLPETRSEMALPLRLRGRVIGVLDVQSIEANAFTEKDVETIGILADQIAIAIENARLISESRQALAESQSLYGDFINRAWERKTEQSALGYYHAAGAGHLINEPVEWDEVQNAFKTGRMVVTPPAQKSHTQAAISAVAVPIRLQNQVIGILDIRSADPGRAWTEDEIAVIEATAERLALALENARLFEETSSRAAREHAVAEITTKIRETNDPQVMIRTAIEELQHVLNVSRVEIIPQVVSAHLPGRENNGQEAG
jgi:GAF domain-containing protein/HAMP domain-containing protein